MIALPGVSRWRQQDKTNQQWLDDLERPVFHERQGKPLEIDFPDSVVKDAALETREFREADEARYGVGISALRVSGQNADIVEPGAPVSARRVIAGLDQQDAPAPNLVANMVGISGVGPGRGRAFEQTVTTPGKMARVKAFGANPKLKRKELDAIERVVDTAKGVKGISGISANEADTFDLAAGKLKGGRNTQGAALERQLRDVQGEVDQRYQAGLSAFKESVALDPAQSRETMGERVAGMDPLARGRLQSAATNIYASLAPEREKRKAELDEVKRYQKLAEGLGIDKLTIEKASAAELKGMVEGGKLKNDLANDEAERTRKAKETADEDTAWTTRATSMGLEFKTAAEAKGKVLAKLDEGNVNKAQRDEREAAARDAVVFADRADGKKSWELYRDAGGHDIDYLTKLRKIDEPEWKPSFERMEFTDETGKKRSSMVFKTSDKTAHVISLSPDGGAVIDPKTPDLIWDASAGNWKSKAQNPWALFNNAPGDGKPGEGKPLDAATAKALLDEAKGDKDKARELAKKRGYTL